MKFGYDACWFEMECGLALLIIIGVSCGFLGVGVDDGFAILGYREKFGRTISTKLHSHGHFFLLPTPCS